MQLIVPLWNQADGSVQKVIYFVSTACGEEWRSSHLEGCKLLAHLHVWTPKGAQSHFQPLRWSFLWTLLFPELSLYWRWCLSRGVSLATLRCSLIGFFLQKIVGCEGLNFGMTGEKSIASWDSIKVWTASSWGCCCSSRASWAGQTSISNASFIVCGWLKSWILLFLVLVCKIMDYFTSLRFDWFQQHPSFMGVSCRSTVHSVIHHGRWIQSCVSWSAVLVRRFDQTSFCLYVWCIVKPCLIVTYKYAPDFL